MAVIYQRVVSEDIEFGRGTLNIQMPAGGTAVGTRINLRSFAAAAPTTYALLPAASTVPGGIDTISDATTKTPGATVSVGGGSYTILVFSNGTNWLVIMG